MDNINDQKFKISHVEGFFFISSVIQKNIGTGCICFNFNGERLPYLIYFFFVWKVLLVLVDLLMVWEFLFKCSTIFIISLFPTNILCILSFDFLTSIFSIRSGNPISNAWFPQQKQKTNKKKLLNYNVQIKRNNNIRKYWTKISSVVALQKLQHLTNKTKQQTLCTV